MFQKAFTWALSIHYLRYTCFDIQAYIKISYLCIGKLLLLFDKIDGTLKAIINLNPFTHVINSIRLILVTGTFKITEIYGSISLLCLLCLIGYIFASKQLEKNENTDEKILIEEEIKQKSWIIIKNIWYI